MFDMKMKTTRFPRSIYAKGRGGVLELTNRGLERTTMQTEIHRAREKVEQAGNGALDQMQNVANV